MHIRTGWHWAPSKSLGDGVEEHGREPKKKPNPGTRYRARAHATKTERGRGEEAKNGVKLCGNLTAQHPYSRRFA